MEVLTDVVHISDFSLSFVSINLNTIYLKFLIAFRQSLASPLPTAQNLSKVGHR